jgi:hypothetical protein
MAESVWVSKFKLVIVKQIIDDLGFDKISKAGCRWLNKSNWRKLNSFSFSNIDIIYGEMIFIGRVANI